MTRGSSKRSSSPTLKSYWASSCEGSGSSGVGRPVTDEIETCCGSRSRPAGMLTAAWPSQLRPWTVSDGAMVSLARGVSTATGEAVASGPPHGVPGIARASSSPPARTRQRVARPASRRQPRARRGGAAAGGGEGVAAGGGEGVAAGGGALIAAPQRGQKRAEGRRQAPYWVQNAGDGGIEASLRRQDSLCCASRQ